MHYSTSNTNETKSVRHKCHDRLTVEAASPMQNTHIELLAQFEFGLVCCWIKHIFYHGGSGFCIGQHTSCECVTHNI